VFQEEECDNQAGNFGYPSNPCCTSDCRVIAECCGIGFSSRISMNAPSTMVDARCQLRLWLLVPVVTISSTTIVSTLTSASSHPACVRLGPSTVSTRLEATIARVIQRHTLKLPMVAALTLTSVKPLPRFVAPWSASTQKAASVADRVPVDRSPLKESVCVSGMNDEH